MRLSEDIKPITFRHQEMRDATLLLKLVVQGEEDVRQGRTIPQGRCLPEDPFPTGRAMTRQNWPGDSI